MTSGIKLLTEFKYQEQENPSYTDWARLLFTFLKSESNGSNQSRMIQSLARSIPTLK